MSGAAKAISACESGMQWEAALHLLPCIALARIAASVVTFGAVALLSVGQSCRFCRENSRFNCRDHDSLSLVGAAQAISACEKGSSWQHAMQLFMDMPEAELTPSLISCNAALSACEKGSQWQTALKLLCETASARVALDVISFNVAVTACARQSLWQMACQVLASALAASVTPNALTLSSVAASCRQGQAWPALPPLLAELEGSVLSGVA